MSETLPFGEAPGTTPPPTAPTGQEASPAKVTTETGSNPVAEQAGAQAQGENPATNDKTPDATPDTTPQAPTWEERKAAALESYDPKQRPTLEAFIDKETGEIDTRKLADSYVKTKQLVGQKQEPVKIPGQDATPDQIAEYRKANNIPDTPEGYTAEFSEAAKEIFSDKNPETKTALDMLKTYLHETHQPVERFGEISNLLAAQLTAVAEKQDHVAKEFLGVAADQIKSEYENLSEAQALTDKAIEFLGEDFKDILDARTADGWYIADHPGLFKLLVEAGKMVSEDTTAMEINGDGTAPAKGATLVEEETNLITAQIEAREKGDFAKVKQIADKLREIQKREG